MTLEDKTRLADKAWSLEILKYNNVNNIGTLFNDGLNVFHRTFYSGKTKHKFVTTFTDVPSDKILTVVY